MLFEELVINLYFFSAVKIWLRRL